MSRSPVHVINGKYCCHLKSICLSEHECAVFALANAGPIDLLVHPSGNADEAGTVHATLPDGVTTVSGPGVFSLDLDCAEIEALEVPEDPALHMVVGCVQVRKTEAVVLGMILDKLCTPGGLPVNVDFGDLLAKLCTEEGESLIDKICAIEAALVNDGGKSTIDKLCEIAASLISEEGESAIVKLCAMADCLIDMKTQDAAFYLEALDCFRQIKANTAAITGIETALGQIGCTKDEDGNITGTVLVCKVSDTTTTPPSDTIKVWWFGTDGEVIENYTGTWEACTNLQALADLLEALCDKIESVIVDCPKEAQIPGADYDRGFQYINGRPPANEKWALCRNDGGTLVEVIAGADLETFVANMKAAGYQEWSNLEQHYICPCPPGWQTAGDWVVKVGGETSVKIDCLPLAELPNVPSKLADPETWKALRTTGCNDDRRDQILKDLLEKFCGVQGTCCIATGELKAPALCQSYRPDDEIGDGEETTTYSVGLGSPTTWVDLPNPNTDQDVLDALNGMCGEWEIITNAAGQRTLCNLDVGGTCGAARFKVCSRGDGANGFPIFQCGLSTSTSLLVQPTFECVEVVKTEGCYDKSIADNLENMDKTLSDLYEKQCEANEMASDAAIKDCMLADFFMNCADDAKLVEPLNKEAQTLCLEGDVAAQYNAGQTIALKNAAGDVCGSATVAAGESPAEFEAAEEGPGKTTVKIVECELAEGKTPVQIKTAKPVLVATVKAVKAVVKNVSILQAKSLKKATIIKQPVKGTVGTVGTLTPRPGG